MLHALYTAARLLLDCLVVAVLGLLGALLINFAIDTIDSIGILCSFFCAVGGALCIMGAAEHLKSTISRPY